MLDIRAVEDLHWEELYGIVDGYDNFVVEPIYREIYQMHNGYFSVMDKSGHMGLLDPSGNLIMATEYASTPRVEHGVIVVYERNKSQIFDQNGIPITKIFTSLHDLENGTFMVEQHGKFGIIDNQGKTIAPIEYTKIGTEIGGLYQINKDGLVGFINTSGHEVIPPAFKNALNVHHGKIIAVNNENLHGVVSPTGEQILPFKFEHVGHAGDGEHFMVTLDGKLGLYDLSGNEIAKPEFDKIAGIEPEGLVVEKQGEWFLVDTQGRELTPGSVGWREIFNTIENIREKSANSMTVFDRFDELNLNTEEYERDISR